MGIVPYIRSPFDFSGVLNVTYCNLLKVCRAVTVLQSTNSERCNLLKVKPLARDRAVLPGYIAILEFNSLLKIKHLASLAQGRQGMVWWWVFSPTHFEQLCAKKSNWMKQTTTSFVGVNKNPKTNLTHTIHVWYIYLHLVDFYGKLVGK